MRQWNGHSDQLDPLREMLHLWRYQAEMKGMDYWKDGIEENVCDHGSRDGGDKGSGNVENEKTVIVEEQEAIRWASTFGSAGCWID